MGIWLYIWMVVLDVYEGNMGELPSKPYHCKLYAWWEVVAVA